MRSTYDAGVMYVHVRPAYELRRGFCTLVLFFLPYLVGSLLLATNGHHSASIQSDVFWLTMSMCMASTKLNATRIGCSVHERV